MYVPTPFQESRIPVLQAFMRQHPFATLVAVVSGAVEAMHVPLLVDPAAGPLGGLRGHVAKANPLWREIVDGAEVLAIFRGADGYVSPGWYPAKREHGRVVPTWNYQVVHARGSVRWVHDPAVLRALVSDLTDQHEAGRANAWSLNDAPDDYVASMLKGIVGFEIRIAILTGKMKLSQNRSQADRAGVVSGLTESADPRSSELAAQVAATLNDSGS
jgi:transcriptional regulator